MHWLLLKKWSPEQIVGFICRFKLMKRRERYKAYDSQGQLAGKRHISDCPSSVETRISKGHREIDTVMEMGSTDCIVTLVERKTGFLYIGKLADRTTASLNQKALMLIRRNPAVIKTITADNGAEFHQYKKIEEKPS